MMRWRGSRITWPPVLAGFAVLALATVIILDFMDLDFSRSTPDAFAGTWTYADGRPVPDNDPLVLNLYKGHSHCDWESVRFLEVAWPPGSRLDGPIPMGGSKIRQFIRDPQGTVAPELKAQFRGDATLPRDARPLGFRRGQWGLSLSKSQGDKYIYLVSGDAVERWPSVRVVPWARKSRDIIGCA